MSEIGRKISGAAQVVEKTLVSEIRDFESGIASFISGGDARTHAPEPVREPRFSEPEHGSESQERTAAGQIVANQDVNGTPAYLVQTENAKGEPERIFVEKGETNFSIGQDVILGWGKDGQLNSMEEQRDYGL